MLHVLGAHFTLSFICLDGFHSTVDRCLNHPSCKTTFSFSSPSVRLNVMGVIQWNVNQWDAVWSHANLETIPYWDRELCVRLLCAALNRCYANTFERFVSFWVSAFSVNNVFVEPAAHYQQQQQIKQDERLLMKIFKWLSWGLFLKYKQCAWGKFLHMWLCAKLFFMEFMTSKMEKNTNRMNNLQQKNYKYISSARYGKETVLETGKET